MSGARHIQDKLHVQTTPSIQIYRDIKRLIAVYYITATLHWSNVQNCAFSFPHSEPTKYKLF